VRILVTGSRDWLDDIIIELVLTALVESNPSEHTLVVGGARGADQKAQECAEKLGMTVELFPAEWDKYHKAAGPIRNKQMVDSGADICLAFLNKGSKGGKDCATRAQNAGIPTVIFGDGRSEVPSQSVGSEQALLTSASKDAHDRVNP
jgi:hypothetical protein